MATEETRAITLEDALDEVHGWDRVLSGHHGAERGFKAAVDALREASGVAYAKGDDEEAKALRAHADLLSKSPRFTEFRFEAEQAYQKLEHWRMMADSLDISTEGPD